ncbi:uncharacterized protein LOC105662334 [Megachile rotundata]|uniref:uncharacterized protein LOC105662334 n=1 Tax=Megachile rotundata TaxID=143995 RepID=UPI003FD67245
MKLNMFLRKISFIWLLFNVSVIPLPLYKINLENEKVFEISSDSKDYDEENENELIQPADLAELKFNIEDESRYKPLHSYVDNYNKRKTVNKMQYINELPNLKPHIWESSNIEVDKPFIAGFKEDLDKVFNN